VRRRRVMNEEEIAEKIRYILEPVGQSLPLFYRKKDNSGDSGRVSEFSNEYAELLLQLESKINTDKGKEFFWQLTGFNFLWPIPKIVGAEMFSSMSRRKAWLLVKEHSDIAAMIYLKADRIDEVLNGMVERIKDYSSINDVNIKVMFSIYQVALNEPNLFSDDHLKKIETINDKFKECINKAVSWNSDLLLEGTEMKAPAPSDILSGLFLFRQELLLTDYNVYVSEEGLMTYNNYRI
jgi:hypothetical protein